MPMRPAGGLKEKMFDAGYFLQMAGLVLEKGE